MWERIMQTMIFLPAGCEACEEVIVEKSRSCSSCLRHKSLYIRVQEFSRHPQPCSGAGGKADDAKSPFVKWKASKAFQQIFRP